MTAPMRKIVKIDEDECNGCGLCVPSCAEGAIRIIDGKARLMAENLCDGLGACQGECPRGAITIEERPAEAFNEQAVAKHLAHTHAEKPAASAAAPPAHGGGCPGSMLRMLRDKPTPATATAAAGTTAEDQPPRPSRLAHWPVQLSLAPTGGAIWQDADVLIAADCVAFAMADFHERLLDGRTVAIACPKLDNVTPYVEKLTGIFANNTIRSVTVAHMEVPCCTGLVRVVQQALTAAGRNDIPVRDVTIGIDGTIQADNGPPAERSPR